MKSHSVLAILFGILLFALLSACSSAAPSISVENVWGRPSPMSPTAGGIYMVIKNSGDATDTLLSGSSPACQSIEFHKSSMNSDGTMGMALVEEPLEIPAGGEIKLEMGGTHAMCIMKKANFAPGNTVDLTLLFKKSGEKTIPVEVREK